jgi:PIN domain nuclease of toxin-antitoxin system
VNTILLDTHALLWWLDNDDRLSANAQKAVEDPSTRVLVSAGSLWEIAIKHRLGKLNAPNLIRNFQIVFDAEGFIELPISGRHAMRAALLPAKHKDPFDRVLIAQAEIEDVPLVSRDSQFDDYSVRRIW